jgi:rhomboid protease GluP
MSKPGVIKMMEKIVTLHNKWYIIRTYERSIMIVKNIKYALDRYGYKVTNIGGGDYIFLIKFSNEKISAVVIIDDIKYPELADAQQCEAIKQSFESTYLFRGYENVEMLFLILTDKPFEYKNFCEGKLVFWVADMYSERLISFIDNDGPFNHLRSTIENALSGQTDNSGTIKNRTFGKSILQTIITDVIVAINILIYIYMEIKLNYIERYIFMLDYGNIPTAVVDMNQYYRLFTSTFLHFDLNHIVSNIVCLIFIGCFFEPMIGHIKFMLIYIASGIFGNICSLVYLYNLGRPALAAGASGAVSGVLGAFVAYALLRKSEKNKISVLKIILAIGMVIILCINETNGTIAGNIAHVGGAVFGIILAYIIYKCEKNKQNKMAKMAE